MGDMEGMGRCGGTGLEELSELWTLGPAELVLVGGLPDAGKLGLAASLAYWHADDRFPDDGTDLPPAAVGRLAALLRWPACTPRGHWAKKVGGGITVRLPASSAAVPVQEKDLTQEVRERRVRGSG